MSNDYNKRILVVAAHPDDEVLGCGATIARHASCGAKVAVLLLCKGVTSRKSLGNIERKIDILHSESILANKILGSVKIVQEDFPDNAFDSVPLLNIVRAIENVCGDFDPSAIYTHSEWDVNIDHRIVFRATQVICRPTKANSVKEVYSFEVPSSTEWNFGTNHFSPNVFMDVSGFIDTKKRALAAYSSETRKFPHPRSLEYVDYLSRVRGAQSGCRSAEAFQLIYKRL